MKAEELEAGKLYQVKHWQKGWIIAEYRQFCPTHKVRGMRSDGTKEWTEAAKHYWIAVAGFHFVVLAKGMEVRECSPESLAEINRLKTAMDSLDDQRRALVKELRTLCG